MKIHLNTLIITALTLLSSCKKTASDAGYHVIQSYTKKVNQQWNWEPCAVGGIFGDKIKKFNIDYEVVESVDISEARIHFINGVEQFLSMVNEDPLTQSYLNEIPFTPKNLLFGLAFTKPNGRFVDEGSIAYVLLSNDNIHYSTKKPNKPGLNNIHNESYEEALAIVRNEEARSNSVHLK